MKLKSKQTGEIIEFDAVLVTKDGKGNEVAYLEYDSIQKFTDQWEDYEESKESFWTISKDGTPIEYDFDFDGRFYEECDNKWVDKIKEIGLYFETKEEAEKAVEKLKCFTNLKNHEFMFDGWYYGTDGNIVILANAHEFNDMEEQDLTKVFGEKIC